MAREGKEYEGKKERHLQSISIHKTEKEGDWEMTTVLRHAGLCSHQTNFCHVFYLGIAISDAGMFGYT